MSCEIIQIRIQRLGARERQAAPCGSDCDRHRVLTSYQRRRQESRNSRAGDRNAKNSRTGSHAAMHGGMRTGMDYWRARMDWYHALEISQKYGIADSACFHRLRMKAGLG